MIDRWLPKTPLHPSQPDTPWTPLPGPQTAALESEADELFYGGAAGGGKTDLLLGLAGTRHHRSIIFRRIFPSLRGIIERSREVYNAGGATHSKDSYNESLHIWRLRDGRMVEFGAMQYDKDKENYRGRPHDLYAWDELPEFTEAQFRFVNAWNRSTRKGQRRRVVATGNPPTSAEGEWVIHYWSPWLDPNHPNPAEPGELRWFARLDDEDVEVESGAPFDYKGETVEPRSRTFIPARLSDNPILEATGYRSVLQGLPEPLRSQVLYGDFSVGIQDNPWQIIPTEWVRAAQERWKQQEQPPTLTALGVDVARGGKDKTVLAPRYGTYFAPLKKYAGKETPDGQSVAGLVFVALGNSDAPVMFDVIGVGSSAYDLSKEAVNAHAVNFAGSSDATDKSGKLGMANLRAECYWKFREALDPVSGDGLALPPDPELLADLTTPRWMVRARGIQVESKEDIIERIGRSPDCGDAVTLTFAPLPIVIRLSTPPEPRAYARGS